VNVLRMITYRDADGNEIGFGGRFTITTFWPRRRQETVAYLQPISALSLA
jgi:hypothetical protein